MRGKLLLFSVVTTLAACDALFFWWPASSCETDQDCRAENFCSGGLCQPRTPMSPDAGSTGQGIDDVVSLSAGEQHTCMVKADGTLWCWGSNTYGQLGQGNLNHQGQPTRVGVESDWVMVSAGTRHTCGIRRPGSLWCWGENLSGQAGLGARPTAYLPLQVGDAEDWREVAASDVNTCGLRGTAPSLLLCWGNTGVIPAGISNVPAEVADQHDYKTLTVGWRHACAISVDGALWCWGDNNYGQLGLGDELPHVGVTRVGDGTDWTSVSTGFFHTCGVRAGFLFCWGVNDVYQLGTVAVVRENAPYQVTAAPEWRAVRVSANTSCGLKNDNTLWCWGYNQGGQVGDGTLKNPVEPVQVTGLEWTLVEVGGVHACGVGAQGLACWGLNDRGQLGLGTVGASVEPVLVAEGETWKHVATGEGHACAIRHDDTLWCWGDGREGQLGVDDRNQRLTPTQVGDGTWRTVVAGTRHTCGLRSDATAWCWGDNTHGQLGDGTYLDDTADKLKPTAPLGAPVMMWLAAGTQHTCGIRDDGRLVSWGANVVTPTQEDPRDDWDGTVVTSTAPAAYTSCAFRNDNSVWCFDNALGANTAPLEWGVGGSWRTVAHATSVACAIDTSNAAFCLGENRLGQVGSNSGEPFHTTLTRVAGNHAFRDVRPTVGYVCAITTGEELLCWGGTAQYGVAEQDSMVPVIRGADARWRQISTSGSFMCGIKTDNTLWCWGYAGFGVLGNGAGGRTTPTLVPSPPT
ncbi:MAG: hypothetical protein AB2A00_23855 [Myxococcota bacterium]